MAVFKNHPDEWQRLDWQILQNSWTSLYWKQAVIDNDINWFKKEKYQIVDMNCKKWTDINTMYNDLTKNLEIPDYYGNNFNALNDCLSDLIIKDAGLVIVFRHFQFVDKDIAHRLLNIFAINSRLHALFGEILLTLVQVDDSKYQIDAIGSCNVLWNNTESENSERGL